MDAESLRDQAHRLSETVAVFRQGASVSVVDESAGPARECFCTRRQSSGAFHSCTVRLRVWITGRRSTLRSPHQPAARASTAPAAVPASGTSGDGAHSNSNA